MLNQNKVGSINLKVFDSPESAASSLAQKLIDQTRESIQEKAQCVWALSGGSTILKLYDALADRDAILKKFADNLTVIWVDERVVPHTDKNSNFGNAHGYFWNRFENAQLIPVPYHQNVEEAAREYESTLSANGIEMGDVDITILGMGTDGHTASLFPHNRALNERSNKIVAVQDPSVQLPRVSMAYPFINSSKHIYMLLYGEEKAQTFRRAVKSGAAEEYPVMGIKKDKLEIYTDQNLIE